jgi:hypothetical protein
MPKTPRGKEAGRKSEEFLTISETAASGQVFHVNGPKSQALQLYTAWLERLGEKKDTP